MTTQEHHQGLVQEHRVCFSFALVYRPPEALLVDRVLLLHMGQGEGGFQEISSSTQGQHAPAHAPALSLPSSMTCLDTSTST